MIIEKITRIQGLKLIQFSLQGAQSDLCQLFTLIQQHLSMTEMSLLTIQSLRISLLKKWVFEDIVSSSQALYLLVPHTYSTSNENDLQGYVLPKIQKDMF